MRDDAPVTSERGDPSDSDDSADAMLREIARAPSAPWTGVPERIGHFRVLNELGRGGMGIVYRARDDTLARTVALKVLPRALEADAVRRKRLLREARAVAALSHPNIATVFEVGESDGRVYIALELAPGRSLRERLASTPMPVGEALAIGSQLAAALALAHKSGIVHRDLKPENVMVSEEGQVKVLDFGLAKVVGGADDATPSAVGQLDTVTQEAQVLGTPAYMAPEQARGQSVTAAADVYAFGVTLYEMLMGTRPPPNVGGGACAVGPEVPEAMHRFLERCLRADPAERFADGAALVAALAEMPLGEAPPSTPSPPPRAGVGPLEPATAPTLSPEPTESRAHAPPPRTKPWRRARVAALAVAAAAVAGAAVLLSIRSVRQRPPPPKVSGMVRLDGGDFTMGRTAEEIDQECQKLTTFCRRDTLEREQPAHVVRIDPFYLDAHEATNEEAAAWVAAAAVDLKPDTVTGAPRYVVERGSGTLLVDTDPSFSGLSIEGRAVVVRPTFARKPAVQITWDGARSYCASRGKRLPTEAEWEFASRGRTARRFPWGNEEPTCGSVVVGRDEGLPCDGTLPWSSASIDDGSMDETPERVHALGGNVSEWVEDAYTSPYYEDCGECRNPVAHPTANAGADVRVIRGGAWSKYLFTHASARGRWNRDSVAGAIGARCALSASR